MFDAVIMFLGGFLSLSLGYRVIGPRSGANPPFDPKQEKLERFYRFSGVSLLLCGAFLMTIKWARK